MQAREALAALFRAGMERGDMAHLEVKTAQGMKRLKLGPTPVTIGRLSDNTVVDIDDLTSRRNCVIEPCEV